MPLRIGRAVRYVLRSLSGGPARTHRRSPHAVALTTASEHRDSLDTDLPAVTWVGLKINGTSGGGVADATGTVDFTARFKDQSDGGATRVHRENSRFRREDGLWVYVDGAVATTPVGKTGRNDPCPCESGKKFKRCCGK